LQTVDKTTGYVSLIDIRSYARYVSVTVVIGATALLAWALADVLLLAFAGIVFATVLRALADPLHRRLHLSERWSVILVVLVLTAIVAGAAWLFGNQIVQQMGELARRLPEAAQQIMERIERSPLAGTMNDAIERAGESTSGTLKGLTRFATVTLGAVANALLIVFLALYLALEPRRYLKGALRLIPIAGRDNAERALLSAGRALRKWLLGQGIAMLGVGIATGIGLAIAGVPLALALGIVAGLADFVPIIGPIAAAIPGILMGFTVGPDIALYAAIVYLVVQQLEGNLITPLAQRWAVALPPAIALVSVVAFGVLFGILGVLFATPLAVVTMVLVRELYVEDVLESPEGRRAARRAQQAP